MRHQGKIRGANLGNWLVLERWMEPSAISPFAGTVADDESSLAKELPPDVLAKRLARHRSSYVTRDTFLWLADVGANLVRIPVGWQLFGDECHPTCVPYLDQAFLWAEETGLSVLVDLHSVPGGQNAFDNSGTSGLCTWHLAHEHIEDTLALLERLASRYGQSPALFGLEVMNEPASRFVLARNLRRYGVGHEERVARSAAIPHEVLTQFYRLCYERLHPLLASHAWLVFHDQFQLARWERLLPRDRYPGVCIDTHHYLATYTRAAHLRSMAAHLALSLALGALVGRAQRFHPVIVGEWSLAHNLRRDEDPERRDEALRRLAKSQLAAFDRGIGSCFWSTHNGRIDEWSLERCIEHGWLDLRA